jgi:hypothetical protein
MKEVINQWHLVYLRSEYEESRWSTYGNWLFLRKVWDKLLLSRKVVSWSQKEVFSINLLELVEGALSYLWKIISCNGMRMYMSQFVSGSSLWFSDIWRISDGVMLFSVLVRREIVTGCGCVQPRRLNRECALEDMKMRLMFSIHQVVWVLYLNQEVCKGPTLECWICSYVISMCQEENWLFLTGGVLSLHCK